MQLVYAERALRDMLWFRRYYADVFPAGRGTARDRLLRTEALVVENPSIGHPVEPGSDLREFPVLRTPFSMLYRLKEDRIEVLRILDNRAEGQVTPR